MERPELEDLDRGERLNRYGFRLPDASFTEEYISDAAPFAVGYSRPDRPERPEVSFGKVNDKDIEVSTYKGVYFRTLDQKEQHLIATHSTRTKMHGKQDCQQIKPHGHGPDGGR